MTRILITGASGLLGVNLAVQAAPSYQVAGASRRALHSTPFEAIQADFLHTDAVSRLLDACRPEAVIHCAAAADVDFCEQHPDEARLINVDVAERIASECARRGIRLVHISTDAVFDGQKEGAYTENDAPHPQGVYAASKLAGERAVAQANARAVVARVNFFGWSISGQRSLAEFFVNNLSKKVGVRGFTDVMFCPMFVGQLATLLLQIMKSSLRGLYHAVGTDAMSKFDFGHAIARQFGLDPGLIAPQSVDDSGLLSPRSHNLRLDTSKLSTDLGVALPDFSTGLRQFHTQFLDGYPQLI
ncbi:MAG: SDR family oxidoreductase, partial [Anaerolineales bacterium]